MVNDVLFEMSRRGWPLTKAAYLMCAAEPDSPTFPLDAELAVRVPSWLPGRMPTSLRDVLPVGGIVRTPAGPLALMREKSWPWTKAVYIKALYYPRRPDAGLPLQHALGVWVPGNLPGEFPVSARELKVKDAPPEAIALARRIRWSSVRAVSVTMNVLGVGKDEAIVELVTHDGLARRIVREVGLSRQEASIAIVQAHALLQSLLRRHPMPPTDAIIELARTWR